MSTPAFGAGEEEAKVVLGSTARPPGHSSRAPAEWATKLLTTAFGPEGGARRHVERLPAGEQAGSEAIRRADPQQLARLIQDDTRKQC